LNLLEEHWTSVRITKTKNKVLTFFIFIVLGQQKQKGSIKFWSFCWFFFPCFWQEMRKLFEKHFQENWCDGWERETLWNSEMGSEILLWHVLYWGLRLLYFTIITFWCCKNRGSRKRQRRGRIGIKEECYIDRYCYEVRRRLAVWRVSVRTSS